jgi:uncharacterized protein
MFEPGTIPMAVIGGAVIGAAAVLMLALNGRILGVSGIAAGMLAPSSPDRGLRALFIAGMLTGGLLVGALMPQALPGALTTNLPWLIAAGLLVGFDTRLGAGCTSGHGVCGISRLSPRSITATLIFMAVAFATVFITRHVIGGGV